MEIRKRDIKYIKELEEIIEQKDPNVRRLITLNVLIDHKVINRYLGWYILSLNVGDEEDAEANRQMLKRTIEWAMEIR